MTEPWFNPNLYSWIPGTLLGIWGGIEGTLCGVLASRGKAKGLVYGIHFTGIVLSALLAVAAIVAWLSGQPWGIWYGLGLPGVLGLGILGSLTPVILRTYREAELRKSIAKDL